MGAAAHGFCMGAAARIYSSIIPLSLFCFFGSISVCCIIAQIMSFKTTIHTKTILSISSPIIDGVPLDSRAADWNVQCKLVDGTNMVVLTKKDQELKKWLRGSKPRGGYDQSISAMIDAVKGLVATASRMAMGQQIHQSKSKYKRKKVMNAMKAIQSSSSAKAVEIVLPAIDHEGQHVDALTVKAAVDVAPVEPLLEVSHDVLKWMWFKYRACAAQGVVLKKRAAYPPLERYTTWHSHKKHFVRRACADGVHTQYTKVPIADVLVQDAGKPAAEESGEAADQQSDGADAPHSDSDLDDEASSQLHVESASE